MQDNHFLDDKKFITKYKVFKDYLIDLYPNINLNISVDNDIENSIKALENEQIDGLTINEVIEKIAKSKVKDYKSLTNKALFKFMDLIDM
jgi:hypothetical protein